LHKQDFEKAAEAFTKVGQEYPNEVQLASRANTYLQLCQSKIERPGMDDQTSSYDLGVFEHNNGNYDAALKLFSKSLKEDSEKGYAYLAMAATECRRGNLEAALENLARAVEADPDTRITALNDPDLEPLRETEGYQRLVEKD